MGDNVVLEVGRGQQGHLDLVVEAQLPDGHQHLGNKKNRIPIRVNFLLKKRKTEYVSSASLQQKKSYQGFQK